MVKLDDCIKNNLKDHVLISSFCRDTLKDVELCIGIDEAGRGPVLGPMVYSAFFCPQAEESKLQEMKCADSKALTAKQREDIFDRINELNTFCGYAIKVLSPNTISNSMLKREKYNLNEISHDTAIHLISEILNVLKLNVKSVYVDTVGDPKKYQSKLEARFPTIPKIRVTAKADSLFPCVSASSICAKVTRDNLLHNWIFLENVEKTAYGSGYPGDPETCKFLAKSLNRIFGFVKLIRFSWSTSAKIVNAKCVPVKWIDNFIQDGDEDGKPAKPKPKVIQATSSDKNNGSILSFFAKSKATSTTTSTSNKRTCSTHDSQFMLDRKLKITKFF